MLSRWEQGPSCPHAGQQGRQQRGQSAIRQPYLLMAVKGAADWIARRFQAGAGQIRLVLPFLVEVGFSHSGPAASAVRRLSPAKLQRSEMWCLSKPISLLLTPVPRSACALVHRCHGLRPALASPFDAATLYLMLQSPHESC